MYIITLCARTDGRTNAALCTYSRRERKKKKKLGERVAAASSLRNWEVKLYFLAGVGGWMMYIIFFRASFRFDESTVYLTLIFNSFQTVFSFDEFKS